MLFSNTAVSSLTKSSLLVIAIAATTSVVGGATTKNRKLSKGNSPPSPPMTKCPSATLYFRMGYTNEIGGDINLVNPANPPRADGQDGVCNTNGLCIGDTITLVKVVYSDMSLTNKVGTLASVSKIAMIEEDNSYGKMVTGSILYDNGTEINFGGYFHEGEYGLVGRGPDLAVTGGTGDCALNMGMVDFIVPGNSIVPLDAIYGLIEFHDITDMNMMMGRVRSLL